MCWLTIRVGSPEASGMVTTVCAITTASNTHRLTITATCYFDSMTPREGAGGRCPGGTRRATA